MSAQSSKATVNGLHHVTAIASSAQRNVDFYASVLGLRFVKKTVNFDDPDTYHLYYGNRFGAPGTAMTFFPWAALPKGRAGTGEAGITQFSVPKGALAFWKAHLTDKGVDSIREEVLFGDARILFDDPDGTRLALVERDGDDREPWLTREIDASHAIRGFFGVTLVLSDAAATAGVLSDILDYREAGREGTLTRYVTNGTSPAGIVDIVEAPNLGRALQGAGRVHHVAFRVATSTDQQRVRASIEAAGFPVTPQIDRDYFMAIYFRSPGGVLFEVATDEPGFTVDEPVETLGQALRLPKQHEHLRATLEQSLAPLDIPNGVATSQGAA